MRVAVYYNNRDVRIEEVEKPLIQDGEILVKIEASGICGSDVMEWYRIKKAPLVLGHEVAGTVAEARGVARFKPGDRVTVAHHVPCNTCRHCLKKEYSVCDTLRTTNFYPGGFAQYVRVPAINVDRGVFHLPPGLSFEEGSFSEPLGCVVRGLVRAARMEAGKTVLVIGAGLSGLLFIKLAKALGASKIIATDINDFRIRAAKSSGADMVLSADEDVPRAVRSGMGRLADIVVLCAAADSAVQQALRCVERAGTVLFFAPKEPGATYPMPLFELWRDNITVVNSYASPPADTLTALDLMESKRVTVTDMITHRLPLEQTPLGFRLVSEAKESIKVIIEPGR